MTAETPSPHSPTPSLEHARWLLERADHFRASYANRASLVLGIDAVAIASLFAALTTSLSREAPYAVASLLILACVVASIWFAFLASGTVFASDSRSAVDAPDIPHRYFLSASDTAKDIASFALFRGAFRQATEEMHLDGVLAELAIDLKLQRRRYIWLRWSIRLLFLAILQLAVLYGLLLLGVV